MFDFLKDITLAPLPVGKNLYSEEFEVKNLNIMLPKDGKYKKDEQKLLTEFSTDLKEKFNNVNEVLSMEYEYLKKSIQQYKIIYSCINKMINNKFAKDKLSVFILNRGGFGCYKITKNSFDEIFRAKNNEEYTLKEALDIARNNLIHDATKLLQVEADLRFVSRQLSILDINLMAYKTNSIEKAAEKKL